MIFATLLKFWPVGIPMQDATLVVFFKEMVPQTNMYLLWLVDKTQPVVTTKTEFENGWKPKLKASFEQFWHAKFLIQDPITVMASTETLLPE